MLNRLCDAVALAARIGMGAGFAALIVTVGLQVLARNVLARPMIWTGELAQLLFTWLIFVGAAVGLRMGVHYRIDTVPPGREGAQRVLRALGLAAGVAVAAILMRYGWQLAQVRASADIQALGLSNFWMYVPIPVSGALMLLFLVELAATPALRGRL